MYRLPQTYAHFLSTLLWMLPLLAPAQQLIDIPRDYPFVRYDSNHLHYDTSSATLRHFFHKWQRVVNTGQGNVNIVHIGSSHVQGGTFPNRVRYNLMGELPDLVGDRGMIFPYSAAAKCNNPPDYVVHCPEKVTLTRCVHANPDCPLGLCGIAITAHDVPTHIQIALRQTHIDYATRQIILIGQTTTNLVPLLSLPDREVPPSYIDPATRRYIYNLSESTDTFEIVIPCQQGESFSLMGIYLGNHQSGFSYHSIGVNGAALADYQKCEHFAADLRLLRPDLVIFGIGINDAAGTGFDTSVFYSRYMQLVEQVRSVSPQCAFVFITNNDSYRRIGKGRKAHRQVNPNGAMAREVFYRIAAATDGAVWDQFEIMGGLKSMDRWNKAGLSQRDHVHFTPTGYALLGDMLYNALVEAYQNYAIHPQEMEEDDNMNTDVPKGDSSKIQSPPSAQQGHNSPQPDTVRNVEFPYISF
ncbi:MAG: hypothetical protein IJ764_05645 [Bacteroidales bacterium]|nr:hypothetical protein [Bacteroidales bacterium]